MPIKITMHMMIECLDREGNTVKQIITYLRGKNFAESSISSAFTDLESSDYKIVRGRLVRANPVRVNGKRTAEFYRRKYGSARSVKLKPEYLP